VCCVGRNASSHLVALTCTLDKRVDCCVGSKSTQLVALTLALLHRRDSGLCVVWAVVQALLHVWECSNMCVGHSAGAHLVALICTIDTRVDCLFCVGSSRHLACCLHTYDYSKLYGRLCRILHDALASLNRCGMWKRIGMSVQDPPHCLR